jgi:hypothetical protein
VLFHDYIIDKVIDYVNYYFQDRKTEKEGAINGRKKHDTAMTG